MAAYHHPMLQQAVAFDHSVLRHLGTVAQGRDSVCFPPGDNPRMAINAGVIADPDVVLFITFQPRMIENFRPVLDKSVFDKRIAVNLCLVNDARCADRGPLINAQDFIVVGSQTLSGDN